MYSMAVTRLKIWPLMLALVSIVASACSTASDTETRAIPTATTESVPTPSFESPVATQQMSGNAPMTVQFSIHDAPGIVSAEWDFGDGTTSTDLTPEHIFITPGNYEVQLTATGLAGESVAVTYNIEVSPDPELVAAQTIVPLPTPTREPSPTAVTAPTPVPTTISTPTLPPTSTTTPTANPTPTPVASETDTLKVLSASDTLTVDEVNANTVAFRGHSYLFVDGASGWEDANAFAVSLGGYLVTINDSDENAFIADLIEKLDRGGFQIGLSDQVDEGQFVWANDDPVTYTNWNPGEPNDSGAGEDYVLVGSRFGAMWNDWVGFLDKFIVEFESPPASSTLMKWDFTAGTLGWRGNSDITNLRSTDKGLEFESIRTDPHLVSSPLYGMNEDLIVSIRVKSSSTGGAKLYYGLAHSEATSATFQLLHDGQWHEISLRIPGIENGGTLRFDPSTGPGTLTIEWMEVSAASRRVVPATPAAKLTPTPAPTAAGPSFVDRSTELLPNIHNHARGATVGDVDGDGDLDILVATSPGEAPLYDSHLDFVLNINNGDGAFTDEARLRLPEGAFNSVVASGSTFLDVDGDGDLDVYVTHGDTSGKFSTNHENFRNLLWINNGSGVFVDESDFRLPRLLHSTVDSTSADVDGDGDADLLVGNANYIGTGEQNILLLNNGSGVFTNATAARLPVANDITVNVALADIDGDDDFDAIVNNTSLSVGTRVWINDGTGVFSDETDDRLLALSSTADLEVSDVTGDGALDILISSNGSSPRLFINSGIGVFTEETSERIPLIFPNSYGIDAADIDGDGDSDLFVSAGDELNYLLINDGKGFFSDATDVAMLVSVPSGVSVTFADCDGDGDPDIYLPIMWERQDILLENRSRQLALVTHPGNSPAALDPNQAVGVIAAGIGHYCAVTVNTGLMCWGDSSEGQLGIGARSARSVPVDVVGLQDGLAAVSAGYRFTCAVMIDGGARCWGMNDSGQLGDGTTTLRTTPVDVTEIPGGVATISAGNNHACAVTTGGGVKCWGENDYGQLGNGTTVNSVTPVDVTGLASGVSSVSAGSKHTCAVMIEGGARCWGDNAVGQLGDGTNLDRTTPVTVVDLPGGIFAVSAGNHTCAVTMVGGVKCWGGGITDQLQNPVLTLGDGTTTMSNTPLDVTGLNEPVFDVSVGSAHSCALTVTRKLHCWGRGRSGQLGDYKRTDSPEPVDVYAPSSSFVAVSSGTQVTCAVTTKGEAMCWGRSFEGSLGTGDSRFSPAIPTDVIDLGPIATSRPILPLDS